jgi:hypothetical protein
MQITIIGPSQSGKSTVFNLLNREKQSLTVRTGGAELRKAGCAIPDPRLLELSNFFQSPVKYIRYDLFDTPGIEPGKLAQAQHLQALKNSDLLLYVIPAFGPSDQELDPGKIDALLSSLRAEFYLHDYLIAASRLEKLELDQKKIHTKELQLERDFVRILRDRLEKNESLGDLNMNQNQENLVRGFGLLSVQPLLTLVNCGEASYSRLIGGKRELLEKGIFLLDARLEEELLELPPEERSGFLEEFELPDYRFFSEEYGPLLLEKMGMISFFTVGKDECKAWEVKKDSAALIAAGKIHSDIQRGFIRAEVIFWKEFMELRNFNTAREKGVLRIEGKEYIVKDGEIVHFRFQV